MNGTPQGQKQTITGSHTSYSKDCPTKKHLKAMPLRTSSPLIGDTWTVPPMPYWSFPPVSPGTWKSCMHVTESEPEPQFS